MLPSWNKYDHHVKMLVITGGGGKDLMYIAIGFVLGIQSIFCTTLMNLPYESLIGCFCFC